MRRILLCLAALLCIGSASAQDALKSRNRLTLPLAAPLDIEIHLADDALGYREYSAVPLGVSPIGDALAAARMRSKEDEIIRPALARIKEGLSKAPRADMLAAAIRSELEATGKVTVGTINVYEGSDSVPGLQPGDDARNVLLLVCSYEMDAMLQAFIVSLHARYGTRAQALSFGLKSDYAFMQGMQHRESAARGGLWSFAEDAARHWEDVGSEAIDRRIDAGLRDVAAMLAYDCNANRSSAAYPASSTQSASNMRPSRSSAATAHGCGSAPAATWRACRSPKCAEQGDTAPEIRTPRCPNGNPDTTSLRHTPSPAPD